MKKTTIEDAPFYCSGYVKLKETWEKTTDVVSVVNANYVNRADYLKAGEQIFFVRETIPLTTEVMPLEEHPARTIIEVYKRALNEPAAALDETKLKVMRASGHSEIKKMIVDLVVNILKPMANGTEMEIVEDLATGIAVAEREEREMLIEELYDEDRMMKATVDPVKRQKDKTKTSESSRLEMENVGPNNSVKRRDCSEVPTANQTVKLNRKTDTELTNLILALTTISYKGFEEWASRFVQQLSPIIPPEELRQYVAELMDNHIDYLDNVHWSIRRIDELISQVVDRNADLPIDIRSAMSTETAGRTNRGQNMKGKQKLKYLKTLCDPTASQSTDQLKVLMSAVPKDPDNRTDWNNLIASQATALTFKSMEVRDRVVTEVWQANAWIGAMMDAKCESLKKAARDVISMNVQGQQLHDATYERLRDWINRETVVLSRDRTERVQELTSAMGQAMAKNARNQNFFHIVEGTYQFNPNLTNVQQQKFWKALKGNPKGDLSAVIEDQNFMQGLYRTEAREEEGQTRENENTSAPADRNNVGVKEMGMLVEMVYKGRQAVSQQLQVQKQQQQYSQAITAPPQQQMHVQQPVYLAQQQHCQMPAGTVYNAAQRPIGGGKGWTQDPWARGPQARIGQMQAVMPQGGKGGEYDINNIRCFTCQEMGHYAPQCPKKQEILSQSPHRREGKISPCKTGKSKYRVMWTKPKGTEKVRLQNKQKKFMQQIPLLKKRRLHGWRQAVQTLRKDRLSVHPRNHWNNP